MRRREFLRSAAAGLPAAALAGPQRAASQAAVSPTAPALELPKPQMLGGNLLMQALSARKTDRNISEEELSPQMLSDLLWAAWGVNRPGAGGRTAPSAMNIKEMDLYVFLSKGVYLFDGDGQALKPLVAGDHRAKTGTQADVGKAPVSLVYVADLDKYTAGRNRVTDTSRQLLWSNTHAGFIGQNVYLFAASAGLVSWFRAFIDPAAVSSLLNLRPAQKVLYSQGVGYPARRA